MVRDNKNSKSNNKWNELSDNPRNKTVPNGNSENLLIDQGSHRWTAPDRHSSPRFPKRDRDMAADSGDE